MQENLTRFQRFSLCARPERAMNRVPAMMKETWPEFVTGNEEESAPHATAQVHLTGWETVVFELEDHEVDELLSAFSTAAIAP
jgi:hypothetical protein